MRWLLVNFRRKDGNRVLFWPFDITKSVMQSAWTQSGMSMLWGRSFPTVKNCSSVKRATFAG